MTGPLWENGDPQCFTSGRAGEEDGAALKAGQKKAAEVVTNS